jgi:N-acetylneuraminic acid mutarotase
MLANLRNRRGPAWFFTGQAGCYCCPTSGETTIVWFYGVTTGAVTIRDTDSYVEDVWTSKTDGPTPARNACASSSIEANAYVWGGYSSTSPFYQTELQQFVHSTDTWSTKAAMPANRNWPAGMTITGQAYSFCGYDSSFVSKRTSYQYTLSSDAWATKTDAPTPARTQLSGFSISDYGYICGGVDDSPSPAVIDDLDRYDPSGDSWTSKASMPETRYGGAAFNQDGTGVFATGNKGAGVLQRSTLLYDVAADSWTTGSLIDVARYFLAGATANGTAKGVVAGGLTTVGIDNTDLFTASNTWLAATAMPTPKRWHSTATGAS